jgi:hypothetical protein
MYVNTLAKVLCDWEVTWQFCTYYKSWNWFKKFFFFGSPAGLAQDLMLTRQTLCHLRPLPAFWFWLFLRWGLASCSDRPGPWSSYLWFPMELEMMGVGHCIQLLIKMGTHELFAQTGLELSSSQSPPPE